MAILSRVLHHDKGAKADKLQPSLSRSSSSSSPHLGFTPISPQSSTSSIGNSRSSKNQGTSTSSVSLAIKLESPPIILYGQASDSTGCIITGYLFLELKSPTASSSAASFDSRASSKRKNSISADCQPTEPPPFETVDLESVTLSLVQTIKYTKPFLVPSPSISNCKTCHISRNTLARWDVVTSKTSFQLGSHAYPFSHLLPGSLPASCKLGSYHSSSYIKYEIIAEAKVPGGSKPVVVELPLNISRSILRGPDRNSLRVFPPTEVTASAVLPNVVCPKSSFPIELKLDNVVTEKGDRRWRMRKLTWRIEEQVKIRGNACPKHESKLKALEDQQRKAILHKELRTGHSPAAAGSSGNGSGSEHSKSSSNVHHSTIQTGLTFTSSPSSILQQQIQDQQQHDNQLNPLQPARSRSNRPRDIDDEPTIDAPSTPAPEESHRSFLEDFVSRNSAAASAPTATSSSPSPSAADTTSHAEPGNATSTPDTPFVDPKLKEEHVYMEETRTVNHGEIKSGWKSDFSGRGKIELVADISAINLSSGLVRNTTKRSSSDPKLDPNDGLRNGATIACDIDDPNSGVFVNHTLIVEVVIAEELLQPDRKNGGGFGLKPVSSTASAMSSNTDNSPGLFPVNSVASASSSHQQTQSNQFGTPSGAARVLRMQFKLPFTERSGLGIAWDDEVPPTYEDVRTLSPPTYTDSASGTPLFGALSESGTNITLPQVAALRQTPRVIYGIGNTPATGNFGLGRENDVSIDSVTDLDERIQEFTL